ncbi:hypothetical protein BST15_14220 [Mycolicibacter arupensis]|uniref:DUF3761 domain-containing protein n=1 Tax=Mycolicibacter arupensis TaxID=342002 RepID=A0ABX3RN96_9MYCO|nr:hypothetical protein BST15_14220 [Mycolicibacter arupensis]
MLARLVTFGMVLFGLFPPLASADPIEPYCYDQRLCDGDFGSRTFCPDSGGWVGPFGACPSLNTGPYSPGGLRPNESNWDGDEDW